MRGGRRGRGAPCLIRYLLADYGEVISAPLAQRAITDLAALAACPRAAFLDRYWRFRPACDLGQPPADYWSQVLTVTLAGHPGSPASSRRLTSAGGCG